MIHLRPLFIANALLLVFTTNAQTKSPFTYQDMLMLDRISGLAVDPAGTTALFNVRATDMEKNRGVSTLWMKDLMDLKKPEVKVPAGEGGASDVQWAADGSAFFFLSGRGEMWRRRGDDEAIVLVEAGVSVSIPVGTSFQFRSLGTEPLQAICVTMPPWPGMDEAYEVDGLWQATKA